MLPVPIAPILIAFRLVVPGLLASLVIETAFPRASLASFQPGQIAPESPVHRHDTVAGRAGICVDLTTKHCANSVEHQFMKHQAMAREHRLDDVSGPEPHDRVNGDLRAKKFVLLRFARPFGDGFGDVAGDMAENLGDVQLPLGLHRASVGHRGLRVESTYLPGSGRQVHRDIRRQIERPDVNLRRPVLRRSKDARRLRARPDGFNR